METKLKSENITLPANLGYPRDNLYNLFISQCRCHLLGLYESQPKAEKMFRAGEPSPVPQEQQAHILVVEDDVVQRLTLAETLRLQNYIVHEAVTADEAAILLSSSALKINLVITDIWMPGQMDGMDLVEYIRHTYPRLPVIVVSGVYKKNRAHDAGVVFFQKPCKPEEMLVEVARLLETKRNGTTHHG